MKSSYVEAAAVMFLFLLGSRLTGGLPDVLGHPGPTLIYPQAEGRGNVWLTSDS